MALLDHCAEQAAATGQQPLTTSELQWINAYWRACNYLCAGMIYLRESALLREPLRPEHIKNRLLGYWGSDPGQNFTWAHLNRAIRKYDLNMIYISGPGHGAPAMIANAYLEGTYQRSTQRSRKTKRVLKPCGKRETRLGNKSCNC